MDSDDLIGLPANLALRLNRSGSDNGQNSYSSYSSFVHRKKSRSLSSLTPPRQGTSSSVSSPNRPILKGVLRPSRSLPQLSAFASRSSLTSIPEGENEDDENEIEDIEEKNEAVESDQNSDDTRKNLKWGGVEEYCPNDDTDSRASNSKADLESSEDEEEDDGWGWYEEDPSATTVSTGSGMPEKERRQSRTESLTTEPQRGPKVSKPLVRVLSQSTPLDPEPEQMKVSNNEKMPGPSGGSLLLLGSDQWPERRTRRRRDKVSKKLDFTNGSSGASAGKTPRLIDANLSILEAFVLEARAKGWPITVSSFLVFSRGAATGYALRAIPNYFLRVALWFYSESAPSTSNEAVRTGLFLGFTMATFHVMALNNVQVNTNENSILDDDEENVTKDKWIPFTAALMTPLLGLLPHKSRLSMALFVAARATESVINGLLFRLSKSIREQLPVSKWLFALGSAQVVFCWLFHRSALPTELVTFLDKASSVQPDSKSIDMILQSRNTGNYEEALKVVQNIVYPSNGESIIKRLLLGSGLIELIASDVFSAASLFGPVFAFPHGFSSSLARGARSAAVLIADAMLSGFALISLSRLLRRVAPSNGWWAGFVAGLIAIQGEITESRRVEIALFALTYAIRALYNMAASRQVIPAHIKFGEFGLYFVALTIVLKASTTTPAVRMSEIEQNPKQQRKNSRRVLVLGSTFRTLIKRCIIPG
jgi:hypothetical protein